MENIQMLLKQGAVGRPCEAIVKVGDKVKRGQLIATPTGLGANVHSSVSGEVIEITEDRIIIKPNAKQPKTFEKIKKMDCSAVIIGTTFVEETQNLCKGLDKKGIPYFFVDGKITDTKPKAAFMANQTACGRLLARLMDGFVADDAEIAVLLPKRIGTQLSNNSAIRLASFRNYFKEKSRDSAVKEFSFSADNEKKAGEEISAFLKENPAVKGIAVVNSTAYLISGAVEKSGFKGICVGGFDATEDNSRCIREGSLDFIINQHPDKQGFNAVEATLHYLLYGTTDSSADELMPIDIVFMENLIP